MDSSDIYFYLFLISIFVTVIVFTLLSDILF